MKKSTRILALALVLVMIAAAFVSCKDEKDCEHVDADHDLKCDKCGADVPCAHVDENKDKKCDYCGAEVYGGYLESIEDYRAYMKADLKSLVESIGSVSTDIDAKIKEAQTAGETAIDAAYTTNDVQKAFSDAKKAIADCIPLANGVFSFTSKSAAEKTEILGILEAYAVRNGITGITMFENGGYVMYNERVTLGTETYIPGYGFGVLAEGALTGELASENKAEWKRYYHTYEAADPGTANYLDSQGSDVGDVYGYIGGSYYTVFMNDTKDGYDWVKELAATEPQPMNLNEETKQATTWRFELRTDLKYSTLGKYADKYNNLAVQPEDYITPFKLLLNQGNDYYRGGELANGSGASYIVGAKEYYDATKEAPKGILDDSQYDFSKVGVKVYQEGGKWYFEFTLGAAVTEYYAKYYISSSLYQPVPKSFIELVGVDNFLQFSEDKSSTPVDNSLSLGAYIFEQWDSDQQIVYKKNPNYVYASTKYAIEGIHLNILKAASTDKEAGIKEFLAGKIDASGIPDTYLEQYSSDPRTRTTSGDSCFKLNMNALDAETWEKMFGENGIVTQTPKDQYWTVEPALNNGHFRQALSYAFNRDEFAVAKGSISSVNYLSSNYMSDPENGISYDMTDAHKKAVASLLEDTQNGYSLELARDYFRMALDELEASGAYQPGTPENPTVIELNIVWMYPTHEEGYHKYVKQYWEAAFNDESVCGNKYKLDVTFAVGDTYMFAYDSMMLGQFDIGFGSISGNSLDPLGFFEVLSSDQEISGSFTLNWGLDTNDPLGDILVYNGMRWSFDALHQASTAGAAVKDGALDAMYTIDSDIKAAADGSVEGTITIKYMDGVKLNEVDGVIFGTNADDYSDYNEVSVQSFEGTTWNVVDDGNGTITVTFKVAAADAKWFVDAAYANGIDVYFGYDVAAADIHVAPAYIKTVDITK